MGPTGLSIYQWAPVVAFLPGAPRKEGGNGEGTDAESFRCSGTSWGCTLAVSFLFLLLSVCHIYSYFHWTIRNIWSVCSREAGLPKLGLGEGVGGVWKTINICQETQASPVEKMSQLNVALNSQVKGRTATFSFLPPVFLSASLMSNCSLFLNESMRKLQKRRMYENRSREDPLAGTNPWLHLPVCPHDSQSGLQRHNNRDRNIPTQCHQSPRKAANC